VLWGDDWIVRALIWSMSNPLVHPLLGCSEEVGHRELAFEGFTLSPASSSQSSPFLAA
jgi:hypothetical protein